MSRDNPTRKGPHDREPRTDTSTEASERGRASRPARLARARREVVRSLGTSASRPGLLRRLLAPGWENAGPLVLRDGTDGTTRAEALDWELVLQARHLPCRLRRLKQDAEGEARWTVMVQPWFLDRAVSELVLWREENEPAPAPALLPPPEPGEVWPSVAALLCLLLFFVWYRSPHPGLGIYEHDWLTKGSAEAAAILAGEWWRALTALTLHADGPHVVGNVAVGGVLIVLACRELGNGLAWLLVLCAGLAGNLVNAAVLGPPHDSIGFSTAVFGAAGVLAGSRLAEGRGMGSVRRAFVPVAAGLGILAMLGAGDGNTDLGAHLFGFLAGLVLGVFGGWWAVLRGRPEGAAGGVLLLAALAAPVLAWIRAFR